MRPGYGAFVRRPPVLRQHLTGIDLPQRPAARFQQAALFLIFGKMQGKGSIQRHAEGVGVAQDVCGSGVEGVTGGRAAPVQPGQRRRAAALRRPGTARIDEGRLCAEPLA